MPVHDSEPTRSVASDLQFVSRTAMLVMRMLSSQFPHSRACANVHSPIERLFERCSKA